jgi:tetratricopeptide (TPR) repeat protein
MANPQRASLLLIPVLSLMVSAQRPQRTLNGVVLENTLSGRGVDSVQVSADPPGSPLTTKTDGAFVLDFPGRNPGIPVTITLVKHDFKNNEDYVVVNDVQLKTVLPSDPGYKLTLIICRKHEREGYARLFYKLKSIERIEQSFAARNAALKIEKEALSRQLQAAESAASAEREELQRKLKEKEELLAQLKEQTLRAETAAQTVSDALADATAGENLKRYREAMRLFLEGDTNAALNLLDNEAIGKQADAANQKIAGGEEDLKQAVDQWLLEASLLITQLRIDEAEAVYKMAASNAQLSFDANYYYGQFERALHSHDNAIAAFEQSRKVAALKGDAKRVGLSLTGMGNTYSDKGAYDLAIRKLQDASNAYETLAQTDPASADPLRVGGFINLGVVLRRQNKQTEAKEQFDKAAAIIHSLPDPELPGNLHLAAIVQLNTGNIRRDKGSFRDAYGAYLAATAAFDKLARDDPGSYRPEQAQALNNLGEIENELAVTSRTSDERTTLLSDSERHLEAAKAFRQALANAIPRAYVPDYAQTLTNLGLLYSVEGKASKAVEALVEAKSARFELVRNFPGVYENEYANTLTILGSVYGQEYDRSGHSHPELLSNAIDSLEEAVKVLEPLSKSDPGKHVLQFGKSLDTLGRAYAAENHVDDARTAYEKALAAYKTIEPTRARYPAFRTSRSIGYLELRAGRREKAVSAFTEAQTYADQFSDQEKLLYEHDILDVARTLVALRVLPANH